MAGFAIIAEFPLGTYRGHGEDGTLDAVPSPARLGAALMAAAAAGPRAVQDGDLLEPAPDDLVALRWLEVHPPDGVGVPALQVNQSDGVAYRTRLFTVRNKSRTFARDRQSLGSVAVGGEFAWVWKQPPPPPIHECLTALCRDVSHLGMAESPVRLRTGTADPTHDLDPDADWWGRGRDDLDLAVSGPGRVEALATAYRTDNAVPPSKAADRAKGGEKQLTPTRTASAVGQMRYAARVPSPPATPWEQVLLAELNKPIEDARRVRWAASIHGALIKAIGHGAPPVLTGAYAQGTPRHTNRCAIQFLGAVDEAPFAGWTRPMAALLIPAGIDAADLQVVEGAWRQLTTIHPGGYAIRLSNHTTRRADQFWTAPPAGARRLWRTSPAAVCDTRGQGSNWTLADAVALSIGMVFRDQMGVPLRKGASWYQELAEAARKHGARIHHAAPIRDGDLSRFVHKVSDRFPIRPYQAQIDLGRLTPPQGLVAIGQSRHMGAGLLVPLDVPTPALEDRA